MENRNRHSVRFGQPTSSRRDVHRLKRSRSQYMSTPHLSGSAWQLNHLNPNFRKSQMSIHMNANMRKSQNSVYIHMPTRSTKNRHIASAHKLIDGLNDDDDATFKSRLRTILHSYNFQILLVVMVILDCIMVLGEMIIEMQMSANDCGEHADPPVPVHGHGHVTENDQMLERVTEAVTELVRNFTEPTNDSMESSMPEHHQEEHMEKGICRYSHILLHLEEYFHLTSIFILFSFNVDLALHLYTDTYRHFLHLENALDALIVVVSFWLDIAFLDSGLKKYLYLLIILRLWRVLRIFHAIMTAIKTPYERQIEKLKKKRRILQRDLAKAYFYSNILEDEIKNLRRYIEDMDAGRATETEDDDDDDDATDGGAESDITAEIDKKSNSSMTDTQSGSDVNKSN